MVNYVPHVGIDDGVNVEELHDTDCFTWSSPIESLEELETAINA